LSFSWPPLAAASPNHTASHLPQKPSSLALSLQTSNGGIDRACQPPLPFRLDSFATEPYSCAAIPSLDYATTLFLSHSSIPPPHVPSLLLSPAGGSLSHLSLQYKKPTSITKYLRDYDFVSQEIRAAEYPKFETFTPKTILLNP
ncbi:hypothetical protein DVH24_023639, partial [Malus domestica]